MCQDYVFSKAWRIETPLGLFHVRIEEFPSFARACVGVDGGGSPPGQTDSRINSENFFEVGVVFLVLNLFAEGTIDFSKKTNH